MDDKTKSKITSETASVVSPEQTTPYSFFGKQNWKKWVLTYFVIGLIVYSGIYYFVLTKKTTNPYSNNYPTPTQITQSIFPTTETANWKTYVNTKYGYEFKYPSDFGTIFEENSQTRLMKGMGYIFEVKRVVTASILTDWLINEKKNGQFRDGDWTVTATRFAGKPALFLQSHYVMQVPGDMYAIQTNNVIYTIFFDKEDSLKAIVNQILSTFKFTN